MSNSNVENESNIENNSNIENEPESEEPESDEPESDEPESDEPESDEPESDEPESDEPESDEDESDEPESDEPESDEPESDEPESDEEESNEEESNEEESNEEESDEPESDEPESDEEESDEEESDEEESDNKGQENNSNNKNVKNTKKLVTEETTDKEVINFVKNTVNNNNKGEPMYWVLPNKLYFPSWVNNEFSEYQLSKDPEKIQSNYFSPLKYQRFLKKFMQPVSPYRGILLYHSLGSGKTCTAIGIAEQFKDKKNIVVLLPASLKDNFLKKGALFCADERYKKNKNSHKKIYSFVSYNASNTPDQIKRVGNLDNKVIIIEEAHNLVSMMLSGILGNSKNGKFIYDALIEAKNSRIIALTGTPIQKDPYELPLLANVLRGPIEMVHFGISIGRSHGSKPDLSGLEKDLAEIDTVDYIDLNLTTMSLELHLIVYSYNKHEFDAVIRQVKEVCLKHDVKAYYGDGDEIEKLYLFPDDPEDFDNEYIVKDEFGERLRDRQIFEKRIMGLVSYYMASEETFPDVIDKGIMRVPMSDYQRKYYAVLREKEKKTEMGSSADSGRRRGSSGPKSTFRVYTRQASNFVFPETIPRPYKDKNFVVFSKGKKKKGKKNNTVEEDLKNMEIEEKIDNDEVSMDKEYKLRQSKALAELTSQSDKFLTPEALKTYSPKMLMMLENINNSKGLVFVYSNFRSMEGVGIFAKVLEANGYSKYGSDDDKPKYGIYSGAEDQEERSKLIDVFTSPDNKDGNRIKIIMATSAGAEGLDLKNIRQVHVMDPYWYESREKQVIGRAVRRKSHFDLPEKERNVEIYRYLAVFEEHMEVNEKRPKNIMATDEYINYNAAKRQKILDEVLLCMKEASFDCKLNSLQIRGDYTCLDFGNKVPSDELAYQPRRSRNIAHSVREVQIDYRTGLLNKKDGFVYHSKGKKILRFGDNKTNYTELIKEAQKKKKIVRVYVDFDTLAVYNFKSVKNKSKKPKQMGIIDLDKGGKFIKV